MGFDVYGKDPVVAAGTVDPVWPENYDSLSDEDKGAYFDKKSEYEAANPGTYFRASVWSWRPILDIIHNECSHLLDAKTLEGLAFNDGCGPDDQETCTEMAKCIEGFIRCSELFDGDGGVYELESTLRVKKGGELIDVGADEELHNQTRSAYGVDFAHLLDFCKFLRSCGGFSAC